MSNSREELEDVANDENETCITNSFMKAIDLSKVDIESIGEMIINKDKNY